MMTAEATKVNKSSSKRKPPNLQIALDAIGCGLAVFLTRDDPENREKDRRPLCDLWERLDENIPNSERLMVATRKGYVPKFFGCTRNAKEIERRFEANPDALVAIPAGVNGLIVVDPDQKHDGPRKLAAWLTENGQAVPDGTPIVKTQSGGQHLYFRNPDGLGSSAGELGKLGCDVKGGDADGGHAGYVMAPGNVRSNGARYTIAGDAPGLFSSFDLDTIPHLPSFFADAIKSVSRASTTTTTHDAELGPLLAELRAADVDEDPRFDAESLVANDKGGDRSGYRLALANRLRERHRDATIADFLSLLLANGDRAGSYVEGAPGEGEFNDRNVCRDWQQAGKRRTERDAAEAKAAKATEAFGVADDGDTSDTLDDALRAVRKAIEANDVPEDECRRVLACLRAGDGASRHDATAAACFEVCDAARLGHDTQEVLIELKRVARGKTAEAKTTKKNAPFTLETQHQAEERIATQSVEPLIDGLLDAGAISVLYGSSNVGKSFVAAHVGYHVAAGLPWNGRETTKGATLYFALEGRTAFRRRVVALARELDPHAPSAPATFATVETTALDLKNPAGDAVRIIATVRAHEAASGEVVRLIVVDTLAAAGAGMNENDAADMTLLVEQLKRIRSACPHTHIMVVHHSGKDQARGARGHSSLRAAVDTEIEVAADIIAVTKQRDHEFLPSIGFTLRPVNLGVDAKGRPMATAIVELGEPQAAFGAADDDDELAGLSDDQRMVLDAALRAIDAGGGSAAAIDVVAEVQKGRPGYSPNTVRATLARRLLADGLLVRRHERYRRPSPTAFAPADEDTG